MSPTDRDAASRPEELSEVATYTDLDKAHEHGLVILAMRQPCLISETGKPGEYSLQADTAASHDIAGELQAYESENEKHLPQPEAAGPGLFRHPAGWELCGIWMLALTGVFIWQGTHPELTGLAASSSTGLIGRGEWWRPFTALFFHGDLPHLAGNLLSGLFFGTLVAKSIGPWRGWVCILACGTAGNALASALTWPQDFTSIGASTAVFGALGILSGLGFSTMLRTRLRLPWMKTAAPVLAGLVLLGWLGGGPPGGGTDVPGHVLGFACGLAAGTAIGWLTPAGTPHPAATTDRPE